MARPNYSYEKRKKELAKKKKREAKRQRKLANDDVPPSEDPDSAPDQAGTE